MPAPGFEDIGLQSPQCCSRESLAVQTKYKMALLIGLQANCADRNFQCKVPDGVRWVAIRE